MDFISICYSGAMKKFTSKSQRTGELGENIACMFLVKRGFQVIERNFTRKWGEIDVIALRDDIVHFIEVKSVSCENFNDIPRDLRFRPEDQMHVHKQSRLMKTIETCIAEWSIGEWQFDVLCVYLDQSRHMARVEPLYDVVLVPN